MEKSYTLAEGTLTFVVPDGRDVRDVILKAGKPYKTEDPVEQAFLDQYPLDHKEEQAAVEPDAAEDDGA